MFPESLSDALSVSVDTGAGDDWFEGMICANVATVEWLNGHLDTGTYLDTLEYWLQEPDPVEFVNTSLGLYLPREISLL